MKVIPCFGKVWIQPDGKYEKTEGGYKVKGSSLFVPETVANKKERMHLVGIIKGFGPSAGLDDNGIRHHTFEIGQKVAYVGANVIDVKIGGETLHFLQDEFILCIIED